MESTVYSSNENFNKIVPIFDGLHSPFYDHFSVTRDSSLLCGSVGRLCVTSIGFFFKNSKRFSLLTSGSQFPKSRGIAIEHSDKIKDVVYLSRRPIDRSFCRWRRIWSGILCPSHHSIRLPSRTPSCCAHQNCILESRLCAMSTHLHIYDGNDVISVVSKDR